MSTVIKVENLSKAYQLGQIGTGTISRDLERYWAKIRGKEDPFLKIGETNDRTQKGTSDMVWSLKDLNFEIEQGDAVGIIGRNGAGKSTLLKILSRVTSPTTGTVKIKGRVASLLEVGTGFHPELSGQENIFLNGAILGMRKKEIVRKLDEIVDFAGVERYIGTPVKRYSSGMYVRLAFAVAAHLESEILIVDEVLAVGDAEFQKKCLGKMGEVSKGEGRTVLFVSHNMGSVQQLCNKSIVLQNGSIGFKGKVKDSIHNYLTSNRAKTDYKRIGNQACVIESIKIRNHYNIESNELYLGEPCTIELKIKKTGNYPNLEVGVNIKNLFNELVGHITSLDKNLFLNSSDKNTITVLINLQAVNFTPGSYNLDFFLLSYNEILDGHIDAIEFNVNNSNRALRPYGFPEQVKFFTETKWEIA